MSGELRSRRVSALAGLTLLAIRGVLLWVVIPLTMLCWLPASFWLRRRDVHLGQFLGWVDINLVACLERTALRPLFRAPVAWVPARSMPQVTHRVDVLRDLM